ncbi:MAG: phosphatase PAP2 family protein [Candidatus Eremiobacteraeota bacterium]|nr:phosphatase PAP2 family protein [Candidatus Eremiobacteraeota bacterium]MBC5811589.1 phosphatase PAP2 family protein [Candidatus Eremiobacteraeota bacterium]
MTTPLRWALAALLAFAAFLGLGALVARKPPLGADVEAADLWLGRGTEAAWWLTQSGYGIFLAALGLLALGVTIVLHTGVRRTLLIVAAQVASQAATGGFKIVFARPRPDHWLVRHEPAFSYPSGHAVTAVVFYCGLAAVALGLPIPRAARLVAGFALVGWAIGVAWSRVALGAHNVTDVLGGVLFGTAWFCVVAAVDALVRERRPARA